MELKLQIQLYSKMGTEFSGAPITFLGSIVLVTILIQQHPLFLIGKWRKKRSCKRLTTPFKMLSQGLRDNTRRTNNLRYKSSDKNTKSIFSNWKATCPPQRLILRLCPTTLLRGLEARWLRLHHPWCRAWKNGDNRGKPFLDTSAVRHYDSEIEFWIQFPTKSVLGWFALLNFFRSSGFCLTIDLFQRSYRFQFCTHCLSKNDQNSRMHSFAISSKGWLLVDFPTTFPFSFGSNQSNLWDFGHCVVHPKSFQKLRNLDEQIRKTYLYCSNFMLKNVMTHESSLLWVILASEKTTQKNKRFKSVDFMSYFSRSWKDTVI